MLKLNIKVSHKLNRCEALQRIKAHIEESLKNTTWQISNYSESWQDHNGVIKFKTHGFSIECDITVNDTNVTVDIEYSVIGLIYRDTAREKITETLNNILSN